VRGARAGGEERREVERVVVAVLAGWQDVAEAAGVVGAVGLDGGGGSGCCGHAGGGGQEQGGEQGGGERGRAASGGEQGAHGAGP
jgi:hypothetical protein